MRIRRGGLDGCQGSGRIENMSALRKNGRAIWKDNDRAANEKLILRRVSQRYDLGGPSTRHHADVRMRTDHRDPFHLSCKRKRVAFILEKDNSLFCLTLRLRLVDLIGWHTLHRRIIEEPVREICAQYSMNHVVDS